MTLYMHYTRILFTKWLLCSTKIVFVNIKSHFLVIYPFKEHARLRIPLLWVWEVCEADYKACVCECVQIECLCVWVCVWVSECFFSLLRLSNIFCLACIRFLKSSRQKKSDIHDAFTACVYSWPCPSWGLGELVLRTDCGLTV